VKLHRTPIDGLWVVETEPVSDARGSFVRLSCERELAPVCPGLRFVQTNLSVTARAGTVRGMHLQRPPAAEHKLVRCLAGRVFDVAVDLRPGSPTFLGWHATELSADVERSVLIGEGLAHGFQALSDDARLLYQHTAFWDPRREAGVRWDDPAIGIAWPLPVTAVSERDRGLPLASGLAWERA
jgi:dTDP-4-dehydrorhamnose 3,5-epimerase